MSRLNTSFVLGYHGCDASVGERILRGGEFRRSTQHYNWLGDGIYFWGADPVRAWEWADEKVNRGEIQKPFVIGAAIDLRNCLDLTSREDIAFVQRAYKFFKIDFSDNFLGSKFPSNRKVKRGSKWYSLADLDCAVINYLNATAEDSIDGDRGVKPLSASESGKSMEESKGDYFDTVRGLFREGKSILPDSMNRSKTHVQIAVRNPECLIEIFKKDRPESMS